MFQWVRNSKGRLIKVSVLQESNAELNISLNPMEHLEKEQQSQQPVDRNPNTYRSCMVSLTNAPYGNAYNPS